MQEISLVFPHQLYHIHPALAPGRKLYMVEDPLFFLQYRFHQQKLLLHRASMKQYESDCTKKGIEVVYIDALSPLATTEALFQHFSELGITMIHYANPVDDWLSQRLERCARRFSIQAKIYSNPNFLCTDEALSSYFGEKKKYFLTDFYTWQRKRLGILLQDGKPVGGKWTYDAENRKKMPASVHPPAIQLFPENEFVKEARGYVRQHFSVNPGTTDSFLYPVNRTQALEAFDQFLEKRFTLYGTYQDAIVREESYLFHALLTPALNIGLVNPDEMVSKTLAFAEQAQIPLNALEGFIRQIIGWREFVRAVYVREGGKERTRNFWNFSRPMPSAFYDATTGIAPIDSTIRKLLNTSYNHHIERLMVLGNFMCLCEIDPNEVYRWFMEMYIDAYDWVMVPNVYGMSQFADGGLMATKPYISGSNYLLKMSDYKKDNWCDIWDGLFWRFMQTQRSFFSSNPRLSMLLGTLDKMEASRKQGLFQKADQFLESLK